MTAPSAISLNRPLPKFAAACLPKMRLKPDIGEILEKLGFSGSPDHTRRCWTRLPAIAAIISMNSGTPSADDHRIHQALRQLHQAGPVGVDHPGVGNQIAHRHQDAAADRAAEVRHHERAGGDDEPGVDLLALDDVAALERLVETFLRRV